MTAGGLATGCSSSKDASAASHNAAGEANAPANGTSGGGGAADAAGGGTANQPKAAAPSQQSPSSITSVALANRSLVYTASLTVRVKDVLAATADAEQLAAANGGFVGDEKSQSGGADDSVGVVESVVTLRVPSEKFDAVLGRLGTGGTVEQQARSASDVTDQVVDTTSRITTEQTAISRLTDLIKTAGGLNDIVTLEGELSRREADLDSMKSRLAALQDQVQLSTITVTYHTPAAPAVVTPPPKRHNAFMRGLTAGWHAFENVARVLVIAVGGLLPFALLALVLWWPARRIYAIRQRALARIAEDRAEAQRLAAQRANGDLASASAAAVAEGSK